MHVSIIATYKSYFSRNVSMLVLLPGPHPVLFCACCNRQKIIVCSSLETLEKEVSLTMLLVGEGHSLATLSIFVMLPREFWLVVT